MGRSQFGIEAEFYGMDSYSAVEVLRRAKVNAMDDGYHHETRPYWRITEDGSVSHQGLELVSPILHPFGRTKPMVRGIVGTLRENGGQVDTTCGLHIHLDATHMEMGSVYDTLKTWALFQPYIDEMLPRSRRNNSYARKIPYGDWKRMEQEGYRVDREEYISRYIVLNPTSLSVHGTLEFRQHSGTLNGEKIWQWMRFCRLFMDIPNPDRMVDEYGDEHAFTAHHNFETMLDYLKVPNDLKAYCWARRERLATNADAEDANSETTFIEGCTCESCQYHEDDMADNDESTYCESCGTYHDSEDE